VERIGFLFAGQGSQYVGMGKDLCETFPQAKAVFDRAQAALGFDIRERCFSGPEDMLKLTNISQPAIVTVTIAAFEAFKVNPKSQIPNPKFYAGLSLGEYSALIAAGSFTFEDGLRLVRKRAEIMNAAAQRHPGKMAAVIDLAAGQIKDICLKSGAEIANLNCPGQTVISGKAEAVDKAKELCIAAGAKRVIELEVSGGFHSSLMKEASVELKRVLEEVSLVAPPIPIVSNYTARPERRRVQIRENLIYQMYSSVRWEESMKFLISQGVRNFIEFGPGKVLKGLLRRIDPSVEVISIEKKEDIVNLSATD
jgi:[acyl-carrier-protein] S-malonyltransferase